MFVRGLAVDLIRTVPRQSQFPLAIGFVGGYRTETRGAWRVGAAQRMATQGVLLPLGQGQKVMAALIYLEPSPLVLRWTLPFPKLG